jgi:DNA polymerase II large subunit
MRGKGKMRKEYAKPTYWNTAPYFEKLEADVRKEYEIANKARKKGFDPAEEVEIPLARSMAEKSVGLISTIYPDIPVEKITERMLELEKKHGQLDTCVSFIIAREIAEEKFYKFGDKLKAIDCGIRVGFAYITLGVVASPIEGYTGFEVKKRRDGKEYWCAYFSGPIRSAGTTATCVVLMLIDYLREHFGYGKYDPSEDEVKRYMTENTDYHERVTNLQYFPTEEEMEFLAKNIPIEIGGDPTEKREVSNYKDLERVPTNFIRGGMALTFSEGLAQKAKKGVGRLKSVKKEGMKVTGFDFLDEYLEIHDKRSSGGKDTIATYIKDLVAGRPVYGHPSRSGGFRFRYGRSRTAGFSAASIHPATMGISNNFLSQGTQLKIEKPTKGCIVTSCDSIDGPIVKLKNGSVKKVKTLEEAQKLYPETEEIIYLGDLLFPLGDVVDRNAGLPKAGYVEEWWDLELREKLNITGEDLDYDKYHVPLEKAIEISEKYSLPLHPSYIFYWTQIDSKAFFWLIDWLKNGLWTGTQNCKLLLPWSSKVQEKFSEGKRALELLGVEHGVVVDNVVIEEIEAKALLANLGVSFLNEGDKLITQFEDFEEGDFEVLEKVNSLSKFEIKDKAGDFIGTRMGRPEKAKLRKLTGSPNGLFPIGEQGGRFRSVNAAVEKGFIQYNWPIKLCDCGNETIYPLCEKCGKKTKKAFYCRECGTYLDKECEQHERSVPHKFRKIDSKYFFDDALKVLNMKKWEVAPLVKGVRGMSNDGKECEHMAKAILRAGHNLQVNKDGTIRYDGTEVPITHFKPAEIGTSVQKLKELDYNLDIYGDDLVDEAQVLELKPHDILIPACPVTLDEPGDKVFINIAKFVDEELEKLYGLPKYYNVKTREDLVGQLVACMAPHNCAGVIGRIIGFAKIQGLVASPYMHAAMRRDCDGDEAAVMLLMDVLLNFSRKFLPSHRGGTQDAPLVLNAKIQAGEVDDQILNFETCFEYPLELYKLAEERKHSSEVKMEAVADRLKEGICPFSGTGFTHDTNDFNEGVLNGAYKVLPSMKEKVGNQMELVEKIRAVDCEDVARLVIERHFIRDIRGNLRKFSRQQFRCVGCNEKFRRPPLSGVCTKCSGKIIFTISEGSIKKYLEPALDLANKYNIANYTKEGMEITKLYIESIFGRETEKQADLKVWF